MWSRPGAHAEIAGRFWFSRPGGSRLCHSFAAGVRTFSIESFTPGESWRSGPAERLQVCRRRRNNDTNNDDSLSLSLSFSFCHAASFQQFLHILFLLVQKRNLHVESAQCETFIDRKRLQWEFSQLTAGPWTYPEAIFFLRRGSCCSLQDVFFFFSTKWKGENKDFPQMKRINFLNGNCVLHHKPPPLDPSSIRTDYTSCH